MSDLRPISHWALWMRMSEPTGLPLREQFMVHFWANWRMLLQFRDLALSTLVALVPTLALAALAVTPRAPLWRVLEFDASAGTMPSLLRLVAIVVAYLAVQHLFFVYAMQRWYAPYVRREFARRGVPMCERCGHRLPPASPAACPECGVPLNSPQETTAVSG